MTKVGRRGKSCAVSGFSVSYTLGGNFVLGGVFLMSVWLVLFVAWVIDHAWEMACVMEMKSDGMSELGRAGFE